MPSPAGKDMRRWYQHKAQGMSVEEIARLEETNPLNVQASLDYMDEWKLRNSLEILGTKAVEIAMRNMDEHGRTIQRGMKAEKVVYVNQATGKVKKAPDIAMQLKAAAENRALIETVQPKGPALQLNQQNNFGMPGGGGFGPTASFEAILRKKREEKGLVNSQEAEIIAAELTHEEAIADEFKDLGGEDDGDDGDEDEDDDAE